MLKQNFFFLSAVSSTTTDLDDFRFRNRLKSFQHSLCSCVTKWPLELRTAPIRVWWTLSLWRCHGGELSCKTRQLRAILESNHNEAYAPSIWISLSFLKIFCVISTLYPRERAYKFAIVTSRTAKNNYDRNLKKQKLRKQQHSWRYIWEKKTLWHFFSFTFSLLILKKSE